jgi:alpha-L-fucosidase
MQRRDFVKLIAAAAAARAIPAKGQAFLNAPAGFNTLHQTYEEFCATPESERIFYALVDGKIVETKLDNANWTPTAWGEPPELPGGSWDGVPMQAPISETEW